MPEQLTLHEHPFAAYCWKALIALYERDVPFERHFVGDAADRARLAELWPMGSIPVLVDAAAGLTLPESTTIVEYLDGHGDAPPLLPADPAAALQARLWDRLIDGHVMTPMQKIVADALRPEGREDPEGAGEARGTLDRAYALLETHLAGGGWLAGEAFTLADCAAAPALHYARVVHRWDEDGLANLTGYFTKLMERPPVARVVDEAREYRRLFPLPWPDYADIS
jgi:glutathione S-transferase